MSGVFGVAESVFLFWLCTGSLKVLVCWERLKARPWPAWHRLWHRLLADALQKGRWQGVVPGLPESFKLTGPEYNKS